ncbi:MAG: hypothetical protein IJ274_05815, partial [Lachnospiraceae bacterium]|nr:hypothetical protein [Lachnospiraceae bacterium]
MLSIFTRIEKQVRNRGELPDDFEAEERVYADNELRFAPGAMEGILGHHSAGKQTVDGFMELLKQYLSLPEDKAMCLFEQKQCDKIQVATIRKAILQEILDDKEQYEAKRLYKLGWYFAENGTRCNTVKLGLTLLALFDLSDNERLCYVLQNLGYCEEFTDYVLMNTYEWTEKKKQDFYFELAQKLKGWGKIDVVEMLEADTEEKKTWILSHGCRNSVMYYYLGLVCAVKGELYERLKRGTLTEEEFSGATDIVEGLLEEGPCAGMSVLDKAAEITMLYLEEAGRHLINMDLFTILHDIAVYFSGEDNEIEGKEVVAGKARTMIDSVDIEGLVCGNLAEKTHDCIRMARAYCVDVTEQVLNLIKSDFEKYYTYSYYLFMENKYVEELMDICDKMIKMELYPRHMGDSLGLGNLGAGVYQLDMLVQYLARYPLMGKKLIEISIYSPITRWRNMAAKALKGWQDK